jgi:hypothetical protein
MPSASQAHSLRASTPRYTSAGATLLAHVSHQRWRTAAAQPLGLTRCGAVRLECRADLRSPAVKQHALVGIRQLQQVANLVT